MLRADAEEIGVSYASRLKAAMQPKTIKGHRQDVAKLITR